MFAAQQKPFTGCRITTQPTHLDDARSWSSSIERCGRCCHPGYWPRLDTVMNWRWQANTFRKAMGNAMARDNRRTSERCRTSIGSWWQASSRNARPDESWYWEYWFEREHSPDLAFLIARRLRSLFRWLIGGLRWSLTVEKAGDVGEARMNRAWSAMDTAAKPSARLRAADPDQNGDVEITLAGIVQRRSQVDHATAWDGTI